MNIQTQWHKCGECGQSFKIGLGGAPVLVDPAKHPHPRPKESWRKATCHGKLVPTGPVEVLQVQRVEDLI